MKEAEGGNHERHEKHKRRGEELVRGHERREPSKVVRRNVGGSRPYDAATRGRELANNSSPKRETGKHETEAATFAVPFANSFFVVS